MLFVQYFTPQFPEQYLKTRVPSIYRAYCTIFAFTFKYTRSINPYFPYTDTMASDQRNLDRISTLIGRRPLATLDAEISDCDSSFDSYDVSYSDISDSKESRLFATLFLKVSIVFWASDRQKGPVHKVDQKTIESIFHEIQYCTRHRFHRKSSRTHASDLANSSGGPYTLKKDMFRSSFNDNIQSPITSSIIDSKSFIEGQYYSFYIGIWLGVAFAIVKHLIRTSLNDQVPLHKGPVFGIFHARTF